MQLQLFSETEGRPPLPPPAAERDVLFYALLLGPQLWAPAARLVTAQREAHGLTGRMRTTDTFHISVLGYGFADELDEDEIELACDVAEDIEFAPFDLVFTELLSWAGHKKPDADCPVVLPVAEGRAETMSLAGRLTLSLIRHGIRPRAFVPKEPHLTLLYDTIRVPLTPLTPPITAHVDSLALVYSHRGEGRYTVLARRPATLPPGPPMPLPPMRPAPAAMPGLFD